MMQMHGKNLLSQVTGWRTSQAAEARLSDEPRMPPVARQARQAYGKRATFGDGLKLYQALLA